jgi:hypothetical protein
MQKFTKYGMTLTLKKTFSFAVSIILKYKNYEINAHLGILTLILLDL